jgi:hypothetical protein
MSELGTQVRELIETKAPPLDLAQVVDTPVRTRPSRRRPLLAAVGVTVLVVLVGLASRELVRDEPPVPIIAPLPPSPVEPAPPPAIEAAPAPTVEPGSRLEWELVDPGLDGPWSLVDGGDRFVVVSRRGELRTSVDGIGWTQLTGSLEGGHYAAWQGTVLSWAPSWRGWTGKVDLRLTDGTVDRWSVPGIRDAAIGPHGVVVVASLSVEQATRAFRTEEIERASAAWHTLDGQNWQPADGFPSDLQELTIVGTPNGFYVAPRIGPPGEIWHSVDGRSWAPLPRADDVPETRQWRQLARWGDDAVLLSLTDEGLEYLHITPSGPELLVRVDQAVATAPWLRTVAGPLGIVTVDPEAGHVVYSATGRDVRSGPLSDALQLDWTSQVDPMSTEMAMTDRAILLAIDDLTDPRYDYRTADRVWAVARPAPPDHLP